MVCGMRMSFRRDAPANSAGYRVAVMQLLVEKQEPSREALIEMIQVLWQEDQWIWLWELALCADAAERVGQ